jgi:hypothetical protein
MIAAALQYVVESSDSSGPGPMTPARLAPATRPHTYAPLGGSVQPRVGMYHGVRVKQDTFSAPEARRATI